MSLYTRKQGQYVKLTTEQLRKMRRTSQVITLQTSAKHLTTTARALATWLTTVEKRGKKMTDKDLAVARLPNAERIRELCSNVDKAIYTLKNEV